MAVHFLIELCNQLLLDGPRIIAQAKRENPASPGRGDKDSTLHLIVLIEELKSLDARDFDPQFRFPFVRGRKWLEQRLPLQPNAVATITQDLLQQVEKLRECLNSYAGKGSHINPRNFDFVTDTKIKDIIVRDYRELTLSLLPAGAWKSSVVLAGSILEALLHFALGEASVLTRTNASSKAPCNQGRNPKPQFPSDQWTLHELIEVALDIGLLPPEHSKSIDQALRDYRNFIHPRKEIRSAHECKEGQALLAKGGLDVVCDHLESSFSPPLTSSATP